jgi:flagellar motor switch protein FliN
MEQDEMDALLNDIMKENQVKEKKDEELSWDDVGEDLEKSRGQAAKTEVSEPSFGEIQKSPAAKGSLDMDFILDIPLSLTVELGRSKMLINELLQLGQGSVVELTKVAGEPMDIFVNNRLIARGEVVVINDKFGVRLTDIVSQAERILKLR